MTWPAAAHRAAAVGITLGILILLACSRPDYAARGQALYEQSRYIDAAQLFERTEWQLKRSTDQQRATYALYRGLTFLELGDLPSARHWLTYAAAIERARPGSLSARERAKLSAAWTRLKATATRARSPASGR